MAHVCVCVQDGANTVKLFNFLSNGVQVMELLGDGTGVWHEGGLSVEQGGITIAGGGETIFSGGMATGTNLVDGAGLLVHVAVSTGYTGEPTPPPCVLSLESYAILYRVAFVLRQRP